MRIPPDTAPSTRSSTPADTSAASSTQVVRFYVAGQQYALDIMQVKEIINPVTITVVPHAPMHVEGIIELRGAFLPIIDLRKRLGLADPDSAHRDTKYIVVTRAGRHVGMIVDRVLDVRRMAASDIEPAPDFMRGSEARFIAGLTKWDDEIVMLLDLSRLLTDQELAAWGDIDGVS